MIWLKNFSAGTLRVLTVIPPPRGPAAIALTLASLPASWTARESTASAACRCGRLAVLLRIPPCSAGTSLGCADVELRPTTSHSPAGRARAPRCRPCGPARRPAPDAGGEAFAVDRGGDRASHVRVLERAAPPLRVSCDHSTPPAACTVPESSASSNVVSVEVTASSSPAANALACTSGSAMRHTTCSSRGLRPHQRGLGFSVIVPVFGFDRRHDERPVGRDRPVAEPGVERLGLARDVGRQTRVDVERPLGPRGVERHRVLEAVAALDGVDVVVALGRGDLQPRPRRSSRFQTPPCPWP